jgi:hypothetical protein
MRSLGTIALVAILAVILGEPGLAATKHKRAHLAHPKPQAERQIICTVASHGCREVKKGCHIEGGGANSPGRIGYQTEVCP